MVEERSFENPEFARKAMKGFAAVIGSGITVWLLTYFVTSEWAFWPRELTTMAAFLAAQLIVAFLFWKFAGVPMLNSRKPR